MPRGEWKRDPFHLAFPGTELDVRKALRALDAALATEGHGADLRGTVGIVLGEVLNNVVEHAYGPAGAGEVEIACEERPRALDFTVLDRGRPMPGLSLPKGRAARLDCARDDLPEGGFGWFLVRSLARDLAYAREGGRNRLRFSIPLAAEEGAAQAPDSTAD